MSKAPVPIVDPTRMPIVAANGPVAVSVMSETYYVTFTQISPAVEGARRTEAVVVSRLALGREQFAKLVQQFKEQQLV